MISVRKLAILAAVLSCIWLATFLIGFHQTFLIKVLGIWLLVLLAYLNRDRTTMFDVVTMKQLHTYALAYEGVQALARRLGLSDEQFVAVRNEVELIAQQSLTWGTVDQRLTEITRRLIALAESHDTQSETSPRRPPRSL